MLGLDVEAAAVAFTTLGLGLLNGLFGFYYVKVFMQIYKISERWFQAAQTTFLVINTLTEPVIGYLQDYGLEFCRNRRRVILFSGPALSAVFLYPWFNWYQPDESPAWMPGLHLLTVLFFWYFLLSVVVVAQRGLFVELSTDDVRRIRVIRYNEGASLLGAAALLPVDSLSESLADFARFRYCCSAVSLSAALCFVVTGSIASDRIAQKDEEEEMLENEEINSESEPPDETWQQIVDENAEVETRERGWNLNTAISVVSQVFKNPNFWFLAVANFSFWFRIQTSGSFLNIYVEGLTAAIPKGSLALSAFYTACQMLPRVVMICSSPIAAKIGARRMLLITLTLTWLNSGVGLIGGNLLTRDVTVAALLVECILVRFQSLFMVILADFIDEDTRKHRRELPASGMIFTLNGIVVRPSVALAPMLTANLLNAGGFGPYKNDPRNAPARVKRTILLVSMCLPAAAAGLGFCLLRRFNVLKYYRRRSAVVRI